MHSAPSASSALHAAEYHIDPHKIGVLGFSAGGSRRRLSNDYDDRIYPPVDAADNKAAAPTSPSPSTPATSPTPPRSPTPHQNRQQAPSLCRPNKPPPHRTNLALGPGPARHGETLWTFLLQNEHELRRERQLRALLLHRAFGTPAFRQSMDPDPHGGHVFGLRLHEPPGSRRGLSSSTPGCSSIGMHTAVVPTSQSRPGRTGLTNLLRRRGSDIAANRVLLCLRDKLRSTPKSITS